MALDPTIWGIPAAAALRSIAGWVENSLQDGKIQPYEWGKLGSTLLRIGALGLALHYGFSLNGLESGGIAVVADFLLNGLRKRS